MAATHHPQTDGQSERAIQTLLRMVRTFAAEQQEMWEDLLPMFELALNYVVTKAIKYSPFQVLFGRSPRTPLDFLKETLPIGSTAEGAIPTASQWAQRWNTARKRLWGFIQQNQLKVAFDIKRRYDKGRKPLHLEPGDLVLLSVSSHAALRGVRKHRERYVGPYIVEARIHDNTYSLKGLPPSVPTTQNVQYLHLFLPSPIRFSSRPHPDFARPLEVDGQIEWEVERTVDHKGDPIPARYRVKWKDTP